MDLFVCFSTLLVDSAPIAYKPEQRLKGTCMRDSLKTTPCDEFLQTDALNVTRIKLFSLLIKYYF